MMQGRSEVGLHGKIPNHGDFLTQVLPRTFVDAWDHWLQQSLLATQESLGPAWLDQYLVSPVWRFALPVNVVDQSAWVGIMMASVDSVGRYFPLTLAARLPDHFGVFEFMGSAEAWFEQVENVGFDALQGQMHVDELVARLDPLGFSLEGGGQIDPLVVERNLQRRLSLEGPVSGVTPMLCDALLKASDGKLSLWSTQGTEQISPVLLLSEGLPRPTSYTAMLNGNWDLWHWPSLVK